MAYPSHADLRRAESRLRHYDKALRLRHSLSHPLILVERKTARGRIGATMVGGMNYLPDSGARRELGHVHVAAIPDHSFEGEALLDSLKAADTWSRGKKPLWQRVEEEEAERKMRSKQTRIDTLRYKSSNLFDSYVWRYKQRVNVPVQIS